MGMRAAVTCVSELWYEMISISEGALDPWCRFNWCFMAVTSLPRLSYIKFILHELPQTRKPSFTGEMYIACSYMMVLVPLPALRLVSGHTLCL